MQNLYRVVEALKSGDRSIGIIGAGFIGTTTAMFYAHEGIKSVLYDIDPNKVKMYKRGFCNVLNLENWSGLSLKKFVEEGLITPTDNFRDLSSCEVFFIAVPTEKDGEPYKGYVEKAIKSLLHSDCVNPKLVVIESTLSPKWIHELELEKYPICCAIRRDWFADPNHTIKTIPRIYCASSKELSELSGEILSIVSNRVIRASSMEVASLVKAVENAMWHVQLVAVQELAMAYDRDILEIMKLVSTHPLREYFYPSIKVGGYCVPLGSKYVIDSADSEKFLNIYKMALKDNDSAAEKLVDDILSEKEYKTVGVLGITYKNDLKVHTLSPGIAVIEALKKHGVEILVNDCFYTQEEVENVTGCKFMEYPSGLKRCDLIFVMIDHKEYYSTPFWKLRDVLEHNPTIIDNLGTWSRHRYALMNYRQFGVGDSSD